MLILLYLLVCMSSFGLIRLAPLANLRTPLGVLNGYDLVLIALLIPSFPLYFKQRQSLMQSSPWYRRLEAAWLIVVVVFVVAAYRCPAATLTERLVNVRSVERCVLFFPSVAILTTARRLRIVAIAGVLFAIVGTVITIAQSLHGLDNLFDSPYYDIGDWGGNKGIVGSIARVNLPISNWIAFVLVVLAASSFLKFRLSHQVLGGVLFVAILVNFARSLWLGMLAAVIVEIVLLWRNHSLNLRVLGRAAAMPGMVVIGIFVAPYVGLGGIVSALTYRIAEGKDSFLTGSGTYGVRLDSTAYALGLWHSSPWWGLGIPYFNYSDVVIDVAYAIALVSIGLFGLIILLLLFGACFTAGLSVLRDGVRHGSSELIVIGLAVTAEVVLIIVYQQWMEPVSLAILGFASALVVTGPKIFGYGYEAKPTRRVVASPSARLSPGVARYRSSSGRSPARDFSAEPR